MNYLSLAWTSGSDVALQGGKYEWANGELLTSGFEHWAEKSTIANYDYVMVKTSGFVNKPASFVSTYNPTGWVCQTKGNLKFMKF